MAVIFIHVPMSHEPLSVSLRRIVSNHVADGGITLNELMQRTEGRGVFLIIILLSLPFITPLTLAGLSTILGWVIVLLALQLARAVPPRLPKRIGDRPISTQRLEKVVNGSVKFLQFIEKWVRPRRTQWMSWRAAHCGNALLLAFMGFLLALPIPPVIPFSNTLPCYAIILIAASMMEEDGFLIWFGYAMSLGTVIYLLAVVGVIIGAFAKYHERIVHFFQSWL